MKDFRFFPGFDTLSGSGNIYGEPPSLSVLTEPTHDEPEEEIVPEGAD